MIEVDYTIHEGPGTYSHYLHATYPTEEDMHKDIVPSMQQLAQIRGYAEGRLIHFRMRVHQANMLSSKPYIYEVGGRLFQ